MSFGGGKGGGGSPPKSPKPQDVIAQQQAANLSVARTNAALNRVNQVTPFGNLLYSKKGDVYTATQTLDPLTLGAIQNNTRLAGDKANLADQYIPTVRDSLANPVSLADFEGDRQKVQDALADRLLPYLDRQQGQLDTKLANQGISVGSDAYRDSQDIFGQQKNDALTQLILQANNEQGREFQLAQQEQERPLNEFLALAGQPGIQGPSYANTPVTNVANTDVGGIYNSIYNSQLSAYNNAQNNSQSGKGSILGLAGTLGGAYLGSMIGQPALGASLGGNLGSSLGGGNNGYTSGSTASFFGY